MSVENTSDRENLPIPYFALALGIVVFLFAAIGGWFYTGLINRLGEWQFANFGLYFNLATILIFVALLALIWRIGRALTKRNRSKQSEEEGLRKDLLLTTLAQKITNWLGFAIVFAAIITLIYVVLLPSTDLRVREISSVQTIRGPEGPVELSGLRAIGPTARYRQGFLFWQRTYYFMPVAIGRNRNKTNEAAVFLEVPAMLAKSSSALSAKGVLRHDVLPDEVAAIYTAVKFSVAKRSSVIFASDASSSWAARVLLYDMLLLGLFFLIFSLILKRRKKRLEKERSNR